MYLNMFMRMKTMEHKCALENPPAEEVDYCCERWPIVPLNCIYSCCDRNE